VTARSILLASAVSLAALSAAAAETPTPPGAVFHSRIPAAQRRAYFGELHLHTAMSFDAWAMGTSVTPDQAYRFARGETVLVPAEQVRAHQDKQATRDVPVRRAWPLDFMAVTDHSENMGVFNQFLDQKNPLSRTDFGRQLQKDRRAAFFLGGNPQMQRKAEAPKLDLNKAQAMRNAWELEVRAANANYVPGKFTTFISYEWSAMPEGRYNLHRNVFFNSDHVARQASTPSPSRTTATSPAA
jgi:hypothetical protein